MTTGKTIALTIWILLVAQTVKSLPAMQEIWLQSLGWEDPLEKEMATHSSILAWKIPWRVTDFILLGSRVAVDADCSHEIKRCLLLRRKAMTNLGLF